MVKILYLNVVEDRHYFLSQIVICSPLAQKNMEGRIKYFSMSTETKPDSNIDTTVYIKQHEQRSKRKSYPPEKSAHKI